MVFASRLMLCLSLNAVVASAELTKAMLKQAIAGNLDSNLFVEFFGESDMRAQHNGEPVWDRHMAGEPEKVSRHTSCSCAGS